MMPAFIAQLRAPSDPSQWVAICLAILAVVYLMMRSKFNRKRDPLSRSGPNLSLAQQRQVERQMSDLLVELSEMARQISAQLDTRAAKLELLIKEADEKIAALQNGKAHPAQQQPLMRLVESETSAQEPAAAPSSPAPPVDERHAAIYSLADQGQSAHEIARQLSRPKGEIELILALRTRE